MRKGMLKIYKKGMGAAQFRLIPPRLTAEGYLDKEGAVLIETAPGVGRGQDATWDWQRKITFAISIADIMQIFNDPEKVDIFHKNKGSNKKLFVQRAQRSGWFLSLSEGSGDNRQTNSIPLTDGEWIVLKQTLINVVPYLGGLEPDIEVLDSKLDSLIEGLKLTLKTVRER